MIEYLISILLVGILIYYLLKRNIKFSRYELTLYIFVYGLFFIYLLSIILLVTGLYNGQNIKIIIRGLSVIAIVTIIKQVCKLNWKELFSEIRNKIVTLVLILASIGIIAMIYDKPNEFVLHDFLDSSNYMTQAAYMNESGKYYMTQEYKEDINLDKAVEKTNFESYGTKYKSMLIDGEKKQEMPFYILNKVALANAMSFGQVREVLYVPLVFLILIFLAIISLSEKILKRPYLSILVGLIFTITPAVINNARSTMTELITLLIIIIFLNQNVARFNNKIEESSKNYNEYIGIILCSMLFLTRSDALFILVGIIFAQNMSLNYRMDKGKYQLLLVLSGIMGVISYLINPNYSNYTFNSSIFENKSVYLYLLLGIIIIGLICEQINIVKRIEIIYKNLDKIKRIMLKFIFPIFFVFCFLIRPIVYYIFNTLGYTNIASMINIYPGVCIATYYGIIIFLLCIFMMRKTDSTKDNEVLEWSIYCLIPSSMVLAYNFMHSTHLYWASRRYIYSILPLFIIIGIYLIKYLNNKKKRLIIVTLLLVQNLLLNYNVGNINDMQQNYYVGLSNSLEQFIEHIDSRNIAIYNDVEYALPLVNYINNFTDKEAKLVDEDDLGSILENETYTVIIQDLEEIYCNKDIQVATQVGYNKLEYEGIDDEIKTPYTINYRLLISYKNKSQERIKDDCITSKQVMGYVDKIIPVNENVYFMQGWSHLEGADIKEVIITDEDNYIISKTSLGEYRPGINEAMNIQGADYAGWNLLFTRPASEYIKIYLDVDGDIVLFKEEKLS